MAAAAEDTQRKRELDDLRFAAGNAENKWQWPTEIVSARSGSTVGSVTIPARPIITINKLKQPLQQLENQQKTARLAVNINPKGKGANKQTAEMLQGLYRNIEVESRAQIARQWAYARAIKCGRGVYRVHKTYANDGDDDQDITIQRILNQHCVYLDPFAQEPDWSDGEYAFLTEFMPIRKYRRLFGKSKMSEMDDAELKGLMNDPLLQGLGDDVPGWVAGDDEVSRTVRVAEYWSVTHTTKKSPTGKRDIDVRTVTYYKINGVEILETQEWDGRYIPLIPVIANEENINGERVWEGIIGPAKDAQRVYNYQVSAEIETIALAPKSPFIAAEGQTEPYRELWAQANVRNFPVLTYKPTALGDKLMPPPQRQFAEPPIQAIAAAIKQADADINATVGFFDPSRGNLSQGERSGVALQALQRKSEEGNAGYLDSLATVSMTLEGKVILDLIPHVYDRPGRVARILGVDEEPSSVMLNAPFVKDQDGEPQPVDPMQPPPDGQQVEHYDLSAGQYSCTVSVGKSYNTAREEAVETIGQLIQAEPQLFMLIGDLWIGNMDFPGSEDIAERVKKMLPPQVQTDEQGQALNKVPPEAQQQIAQLQMALQEAQQLADANIAKIKQAELTAQSNERIKAAEIASKEAIEQFKARAEVEIAQMKADAEMHKITLQGQNQAQAQAFEHSHAQQQADQENDQHFLDLAHEGVMADTEHQHDREQTAGEHQHESRMSHGEHQHAEKIAKMKPKPAGNGSGA